MEQREYLFIHIVIIYYEPRYIHSFIVESDSLQAVFVFHMTLRIKFMSN